MLIPAQPTPWMARPRRRTPKAVMGAPVQMAEPMIVTIREAWRVVVRPKMSATWAQRGRKEAEVRLKEEMIQLSWDSWSGEGWEFA